LHGRPGEVIGGALVERLKRLKAIIMMSVGDEPTTDARRFYQQP